MILTAETVYIRHELCAENSSCAVNNGGCEHNCTSLAAGDGYVCQCRDGFRVSPRDQLSCQDIDECVMGLHHCPQRCLNVKGSYKCSCDASFVDTSQSRGHTCKPRAGKTTLLFAVGDEIRQFIPDAKDMAYSDMLVAGQRIQALDFDPNRNVIYWSDSSIGTLMRATKPQDQQSAFPQDLHVSVHSPNGLSFDWVTRSLFWTDTARGAIYLARDDGRYRRTLISGERFQPFAVAVNPRRGIIYWSDVDPSGPKIESAWMNGVNRTVLVTTRISYPSGIAIDFRMNDRVYWCDPKVNLIESMNHDGSHRVMVHSMRINNPFSIDVFSGQMYWVSKDSGTVNAMDKFGRGLNTTLQVGLLITQTSHYR